MPSLTFIEKVHEHDDIYSFHFAKPKGLRHKAGQHGIFFLPGLYRPHPFSLTSAPHQDTISFSTKVREGSRFKQKLLKLKPGDALYMFGPILNFTFDSRYNSHVFLAQGIGITPFHSMLRHAQHSDMEDEITLVHVSKDGHTFKDATSTIAHTSHYPTSSKDFAKVVATQDPRSAFYLSGSSRFISATKRNLKELGVPSNRIKTDLFLGL